VSIEYPEQSYYPGAKIRLTIRLDEFGASRLKPAPSKTTKNLNGIRDPRGALQAVLDPGAPQGVTRYLIVEQGATQAQAATNQARSSDGLTFDVTVIPKDMTWDQNGIRTADTLSATIKFIDCPIDPRCARSVAVEAFIGTVSDNEFAAGIEGKVRTGIAAQGQGDSLNLIPDTYLDANRNQRTNSRFIGWVDKWDVEWEDEAEPIIRIDCRDNTQLFIEQQAPPRLVLDMNAPIDKAIAVYLSHFPQMQGLAVQYLPTTDQPPVLAGTLLNTAYRPNLGPHLSKSGGNDKLSVWDYLTDICGSIGHLIRVQGTTIIVQRPRAVTPGLPEPRVDDPFQGRTLSTGEELTYRRFLYGGNVKSMKISRNYAKQTPTNIEIRCYDTEHKTLLVERFPLPADQQMYAIPGDAQPDQKCLVKAVYGIKDRKVLQAIAQAYYEQLSRSELQCEVKTRNLSSYGGGNLDPDILDMQAGDTYELLVNRSSDEVSTLTSIEKALTVQQKNAVFMQTLGFASDFANAYAKSYTDAGFRSQWRTKNMKVVWGTETGIDITVTGANYIEVRADQYLPAGQEPSTQDPTNPQMNANNTPQALNSGQTSDPLPNQTTPEKWPPF
jgi:hypothetical protein